MIREENSEVHHRMDLKSWSRDSSGLFRGLVFPYERKKHLPGFGLN